MPVFTTDSGTQVRVRFLTDAIARIQIFPKHRDFEDTGLNRYHFIQEPAEISPRRETEEPGAVSWSTDALTIRCDTASGLLTCIDAKGKTLLKMTDLVLSKKAAQTSFQADKDEDWVGFGDQTRKRLYHRGQKAICWVSNVSSYAPVPFFMSTKGYGVVVNSTHCVVFDMCKTRPDTFLWKDERAVVDFYLLAAPTFKELLRQYTLLSGKPKLPPEWAFGLWYICRTQANDAEVLSDALNFRREGIPCDLIGLEPGWMESCYDLSLEKSWSTERFPLPDWQKKCDHTFIKALKRMGFHLELWLCNEYDLSYEEERKIAAETTGHDDRNAPTFDELAELDLHFAGPRYADTITKKDEAWFEHLKKFVDWGADFFKQDGAYQVCTHPDRVYGNGMLDAEMHNLYPLLYARQMWEGFANYTNRRPVVFTPSGWVGFQSWAGTWTGDTGGRLETLGAMLNTSMVGHSWATNDMEVMQEEGIHFGYLQPWSQINSWTYFRMPWLQGEKLHKMHHFYANLRSRLIPYIYTSAYETTQTSVPLMRPLTLEFQDDRMCREILNEYLLGRDLLVGIYKHEIYLPEGEWKDFWSGVVYEGNQTIRCDWPEDRGGALFVRQGAVIPFGPVMQYRHEKPLDTVELYIFPTERPATGALYEDDGVTFDFQKGAYALTNIEAQVKDGIVELTMNQPKDSAVKTWQATIALPRKPAEIRLNGKAVPFHWDEERSEAKTV